MYYNIMTDLLFLISFLIDTMLTLTSLSVKTRFISGAAAGSRMATTRQRFTAHAQAGHMVIVCILTLHFLCILSSDNREFG